MGDKRFVSIPDLNENAKNLLRLQDSILYRLVPQLRLDDVALEQLGEEELWQRAESAIVDLVESLESEGGIPKTIDQDQLIKETLNEALGLGPLEDLLADDTIEEIVVEGVDRILITKSGSISGAGVGFSSEGVFRRVLQRLVAPTGVTLNEHSTFVDLRLLDGSKLAVALSPVAARGPCLTLRKPSGGAIDLRALQTRDTLNAAMGTFLSLCIATRKNILVCGAPSSGKEAVLGALASEVAAGERLITVVEVSHLHLTRERWTALECRPGLGIAPDVGLDELIAGALRMNPDRLVVADVKGKEAFRLIQSMNAACDGTLCSISGEGSLEALTRFSQLCSIGAGGHLAAVREMVASAVQVVVHVVRYGDGKVRITSIDEVAATTEKGFTTIFKFDGNAHVATGVTPGFYATLQEQGFTTDTSIFR